jgi:hypothetical protein
MIVCVNETVKMMSLMRMIVSVRESECADRSDGLVVMASERKTELLFCFASDRAPRRWISIDRIFLCHVRIPCRVVLVY